MPFTIQTMVFRYNYRSNDVFYSPNSFYKVYLTALKIRNWNGYSMEYTVLMPLLYIIYEHLQDLYTLNSLLCWKGLKKIITKDCLNSTPVYILFSLT